MEAKELLTKIKAAFAEFTAPAPVTAPAPTAMSDYELKIGGMVSIDKLEPGGIVMIDGNPAIPGELELADGTIVVIGDNGVITEVKPPVTAPAEAPAAPAAPGMDMSKFEAFETLTNEKFASYEAKFASYETRFAEYEAKLNQSKEMIEQLLQFGKLMVEKPVAGPDEAVKVGNKFKAEKPERNFDILFS